MYSYIKGIVEEIYLDRIILENNGIGYEINVSSFTAQSVRKGKSAKIFTKLIVREDDMSFQLKWNLRCLNYLHQCQR